MRKRDREQARFQREREHAREGESVARECEMP